MSLNSNLNLPLDQSAHGRRAGGVLDRFLPTSILAVLAAALVVALLGFRVVIGQGVVRSAMALALLGGVMSLPWIARLLNVQWTHDSREWRAARWLVCVLFILELGIGIRSTILAVQSSAIPFDQGQNMHRAATLLLRGRNPYGDGEIVDFDAYIERIPQREQAGIGQPLRSDDLYAALDLYDAKLDGGLQDQLLPEPPPSAPADARVEHAVLGYKYGPLLFVLAAIPVYLIGPAAIPLLNLLAFAVWIVALGALLRSSPLPRWTWAIVLGAVLLIYEIPWNFLTLTASDIWPLLFSTLAVLALYRRWPVMLGIALGLAISSKHLPALLFVPLLLLTPSRRAIVSMLLVTTAAYLPFVVSDPMGVYYNIVRWSSLMKPDRTGWAYFAHPSTVMMARGAVAVGIVWVWYRVLSGRQQYLFSALCVLNLMLVLAGVAFHNNYVIWFAPWVFFALAETVSQTPTVPRVAREAEPQALPEELGDLEPSPG